MAQIDPARPQWRKSTHSAQGDDCVEVAVLAGGGTVVRDSKNPAGPVLPFAATGFAAFIRKIKTDQI